MIRTSVVGSGRWPADAGAVVTAVVASAAAANTASRVESLMSVLPPIRAQGPRTGARRRILPREAVTYQGQKTDVKRMSPNASIEQHPRDEFRVVVHRHVPAARQQPEHPARRDFPQVGNARPGEDPITLGPGDGHRDAGDRAGEPEVAPGLGG